MLRTNRLLIRPYEAQDEEAIYKVINSEAIFLTTLNIPYPYPREQVGAWIVFTQKNSLYKKGYEWGIFTHEGTYIGNVGIVNIDSKHKNAEITYFIGEAFWNQGYAQEAVNAMLGFAFNTLYLERVQGRCMNINLASSKVMKKCGFQYEGLARHAVLKNGKYQDVWQAAILKEDYFLQLSRIKK